VNIINVLHEGERSFCLPSFALRECGYPLAGGGTKPLAQAAWLRHKDRPAMIIWLEWFSIWYSICHKISNVIPVSK